MKGLYFNPVFYPNGSGVAKKIYSQIKAFKSHGVDMEYARVAQLSNGEYGMVLGDTAIYTYRQGIVGKLHRLTKSYRVLLSAIREQCFEFIYYRYDNAMNPFVVWFLYKLKQAGIKVVVEIPTYPYDGETKPSIGKLIDQLTRRWGAGFFDYIATFSMLPVIWNTPAIRISNGVDLDAIPVRTQKHHPGQFIMVSVAQLNVWHGIDRLVRGMAEYYAATPSVEVKLYVISGENSPALVRIKQLVNDLNLSDAVYFEGAKYDNQLDEYFDNCDIAIGSLGRHRNGIKTLKTLKNVEYAARGVPFIYSEENPDFDARPYVLKCQANESNIDIDKCIRFAKSLNLSSSDIRSTVDNLDWKSQIGIVLSRLRGK